MDSQTTTGSAAQVSCAPLPGWVDHRPLSDAAEEQGGAAGGVRPLLRDVQIDLTQRELAWHCRTVRRVLSREGAERVAHFLVELDPVFQRLEVHFIRTRRGGEVIEHARDDAFSVFRRETELAWRVLNGRMTASLLMPDVRVDDLVEVAITLYGSNPALGGKLGAWAAFDSFNPWVETRHRLIRPADRPVLMSEHNDPPEPEVTVRDGIEDIRWCLVGQKRLDYEELSPSWLMESPALQLTEHQSWAEVADLLAPHYADEGPPPALAEAIERVGDAHSDPARRAVEWLRFVQNELRYFSLSFGEGGVVPRPLEEIWRTRFGDCKDAALVYVAGARRLGLDACPALISTTHGPALDGLLPSPGVFDHCIARLRLDGRSYWLDPTMPPQGGDLEHVFQPHIGWALPLAPGATALEPLSERAPDHWFDLQEELQLGPKRDSPARYRRTVAYRSSDADRLRNRLESEGADFYAEAVLKEIRSFWSTAAQIGQIEVADDRESNRLEVASSYEVRDCWKSDENGRLKLTLLDRVFPGELAPLQAQGPRRTSIYLGSPRKVTRRMTVKTPCTWGGQGWRREEDGPGVSYRDELSIDGQTVAHEREFVCTQWSMPADAAESYRDIVALLGQDLLELWAVERSGKIRPPTAPAGGGASAWLIFTLIAVVLLLLRLPALMGS